MLIRGDPMLDGGAGVVGDVCMGGDRGGDVTCEVECVRDSG